MQELTNSVYILTTAMYKSGPLTKQELVNYVTVEFLLVRSLTNFLGLCNIFHVSVCSEVSHMRDHPILQNFTLISL